MMSTMQRKFLRYIPCCFVSIRFTNARTLQDYFEHLRPPLGCMSLDQAGVAIGEKAVALGDGVRVGGFDAVKPGQRRYQHQEG